MTMIKRTKVLSCSLDPHIQSVSLCNELLELRVRQLVANLCQLGWGWRFLCFVHSSNAPDEIAWVKITGACGLSENGCNELLKLHVSRKSVDENDNSFVSVHPSNSPYKIQNIWETKGASLSIDNLSNFRGASSQPLDSPMLCSHLKSVYRTHGRASNCCWHIIHLREPLKLYTPLMNRNRTNGHIDDMTL